MNKSCILAVDAGGTSLKAALACGGRLLSFQSFPVDSQGDEGEISSSFRTLCGTMRASAQAEGLEIKKVGVCIPGPFLYEEGVSHMTHKYQSVYGIPVRPWFTEVLGEVSVRFTHDSSAFLLGALSGEDRLLHRRICGVILGTGLGFAAMEDGKLLLNPEGGPAISIFRMPYRDGIAEDYASRRAVENLYKRLSGSGEALSVKDIAERARRGDVMAERCFQTLGKSLGEILLPVVREHNFTLLLLGGAISKSAGLFLPPLRSSLPGIEIREAANIDEAPLYGAAGIA